MIGILLNVYADDARSVKPASDAELYSHPMSVWYKGGRGADFSCRERSLEALVKDVFLYLSETTEATEDDMSCSDAVECLSEANVQLIYSDSNRILWYFMERKYGKIVGAKHGPKNIQKTHLFNQLTNFAGQRKRGKDRKRAAMKKMCGDSSTAVS